VPKVSLKKIYSLKKKHIGITSITAYDASFAKFFDDLGFDIILIGDSLGEVIKGEKNTHNVSIKEMIYHAQSVSKVVNKSYVIADLPKESCSSNRKIVSDSIALFKNTKIDMIKIEFNEKNIDTFQKLNDKKIPICSHLGLRPQFISKKCEFRIYGKTGKERSEIIKNAMLAEKYGAKIILLECVNATVAKELRTLLKIPVIGIGSGESCDGQIIVSYDLLGISFNKLPKFIKKDYICKDILENRINDYIKHIKKLPYKC
tara:strand:- start:854 stop:1633 length:780 start_codon:yes stop_codon:yes gene_type:complete